jgi:hypothetical protein
MIFIPHIIVGATIGAKTQNLGLIVILGLISHLIMDKLPHWDYDISGIKNFKETKNFKALFIDFGKMLIDCLLGFMVTFSILKYKNLLNSEHLPFIIFAVAISLLPDIIFGLIMLFAPKNLLEKYIYIHCKFLHRKKEKEGKITFLGLATEILVILIALIIFFF